MLKNLNLKLWLIIIISLILISIESYFYFGFLAKHLIIPLPIILVFALFFQFYFIKNSKEINKIRVSVLGFLSFFATLIVISSYYLDHIFFTNWFFSTTHFHPNVIRLLPVFLWFSLAVSLVPKLRSNHQVTLFITPWLVLLSMFYFQYTFIDAFIYVGLEDGLVESVTFLAFLVSSLIMLKKAFTISKNYLLSFITFLVGIGLFFIAGEEISWGQRLFTLDLPKYFIDQNVQQEITIHNLNYVQNKMWYAYIIIGFVGGILPWLVKRPKPLFLRLVFVTWPVTAYFMPLFIYGAYRIMLGPIQIKTWEETIELFFAVGVFLQLYRIKKMLPKG